MGPKKIDTVETTFASKLIDSNGTQHFLTDKISLSDGFEIKRIRPNHTTYFYPTETTKKAICLHFTVGNIKGDVGSLTKDGNKVSVNYVVDRQGNIYNLFEDKYWSYHLGSGTVGTNGTMSKQTIGIEISNYGPLKLTTEGKLNDAYGNEYCTLEDKDFYKECKFRGYDYYATMTDKQEQAVAKLLHFICEENNIPKQFKENPDELFKDANEAKTFTGIYLHTSVRKDKFDWPAEMIAGIKDKFENNNKKKEPEIKETVTVVVETPKEEPVKKVDTKITVSTETKPVVSNQTTVAVKKEQSIIDLIIEFFTSLFGKK